MKLTELRALGSQALDDTAEFILSSNALVIYEHNGNGDYYSRRVYKVVKATPERQSFVQMDVPDLARLVGGTIA